MTGIERLADCLDTLQDLCAQLLGSPAEAIDSIRRSGALVPPMPALPRGETLEERDAIAEVRIGLVVARQERRDALREAIAAVQACARELSKAPPLSLPYNG